MPLVRPMTLRDLDAVIAIAAGVPTAPHWPPSEFARMLAVVAEAPRRRGAWVAKLVDASQKDESDAVQGFAMASYAAGTAELEAVVTAPRFRRRGIGSALVTAVAGWSHEIGAERLLLEARVSNREALQLYLRQGFVQDGLRPGYYRNPEEDAVLLSLALFPAR